MKRIVCLAALTAILSIGVTAFAEDTETFTFPAEYIGGTSDTASVNAADYSTVLITKDEENGEIVYIDQADNVYTGVVPFLVKSDPAVGKYKVMLGSETGEPYQTYFYVGVDSSNLDDKPMTRLQNDEGADKRNIGFFTTVSGDDYDDFAAIKVCYTNKGVLTYGGFPIDKWDETVYSGSGALKLIFQLNDVPEAWSDSISVYLTTDTLSENKGTSTVSGGGS